MHHFNICDPQHLEQEAGTGLNFAQWGQQKSSSVCVATVQNSFATALAGGSSIVEDGVVDSRQIGVTWSDASTGAVDRTGSLGALVLKKHPGGAEAVSGRMLPAAGCGDADSSGSGKDKPGGRSSEAAGSL